MTADEGRPSPRGRSREEQLAYILYVMQMKYPDMTMEKLERGLARRKVERLAEKEAAAAKRKARKAAKEQGA
jgi:hypothetical protein